MSLPIPIFIPRSCISFDHKKIRQKPDFLQHLYTRYYVHRCGPPLRRLSFLSPVSKPADQEPDAGVDDRGCGGLIAISEVPGRDARQFLEFALLLGHSKHRIELSGCGLVRRHLGHPLEKRDGQEVAGEPDGHPGDGQRDQEHCDQSAHDGPPQVVISTPYAGSALLSTLIFPLILVRLGGFTFRFI